MNSQISREQQDILRAMTGTYKEVESTPAKDDKSLCCDFCEQAQDYWSPNIEPHVCAY
jgi:hypothetical protein